MSYFVPAPDLLFKEPQTRFRCHVEGWNPKTQFVHIKTVGGLHYLKTPTTRREYQTRNRLLLTRRNAERFSGRVNSKGAGDKPCHLPGQCPEGIRVPGAQASGQSAPFTAEHGLRVEQSNTNQSPVTSPSNWPNGQRCLGSLPPNQRKDEPNQLSPRLVTPRP